MEDHPTGNAARQQRSETTAGAATSVALLRLLGPALDPTRLEDDLQANAEILGLVERLWEAPIDPLEPVPPFTPAWDDGR